MENRKSEPRPKVAAPDKPRTLKGEASKEWDRQVVELLAMGVLARVDRVVLAIWCEAWADYVKYRAEFVAQKKRSTGKGLAWLLKDARDTLLKVAAQFGFTPSARTRLTTDVQPDAPDPMTAFFDRSEN